MNLKISLLLSIILHLFLIESIPKKDNVSLEENEEVIEKINVIEDNLNKIRIIEAIQHIHSAISPILSEESLDLLNTHYFDKRDSLKEKIYKKKEKYNQVTISFEEFSEEASEGLLEGRQEAEEGSKLINQANECDQFYIGIGVELEGVLGNIEQMKVTKISKKSPAKRLKINIGDTILGFEKNGNYYKDVHYSNFKENDSVYVFINKKGKFVKLETKIKKICKK